MKEILKPAVETETNITPFFNKCGTIFEDMPFNIDMCLYGLRGLLLTTVCCAVINPDFFSWLCNFCWALGSE